MPPYLNISLPSLTFLISILMILPYLCQTATKTALALPQKISMFDDSQLVKLAQQQKFIIPLNGRTISHTIEYIPKNSGQCQFIEPTINYKSLAQSQAVFDNQDQITTIFPLKTRQIVIVADPYYNIASFSIDRHFLLKPKLPKTNLYKTKISGSKSSANTPLVSPILVSTYNQQYIYYLTTNSSFVFHYSNVASDIKQFKLQGSPNVIYKAIQRNGYIILCAGGSGILVYKINQQTKQLKLIQQIQPKILSNSPIDMQLNQYTQLLYVLNYQKTIDIYTFDANLKNKDNNNKDKDSNKENINNNNNNNKDSNNIKILTQYDQINLQSISLKHTSNSNPYQLIGHLNIQISRKRTDQTIIILFSHGVKTIAAQLIYKSIQKQYSFVRYYKYSIAIRQIHVIDDVMVVVGNGLLGMFPYGIDPHLIVQQFNGFMTLTPIQKIAITQAPFFVGVSKNQIEFGGIFLNNQAGINCHISSSSHLKQVKFKANLTVCGDLYQVQVNKYCEYQKTFIIKQMQLTASAPVAASLWIATIIFTLLIVFGLCCLFVIQKKKQREIRKLELYFQEKKRMEIPASSDRAARG